MPDHWPTRDAALGRLREEVSGNPEQRIHPSDFPALGTESEVLGLLLSLASEGVLRPEVEVVCSDQHVVHRSISPPPDWRGMRCDSCQDPYGPNRLRAWFWRS